MTAVIASPGVLVVVADSGDAIAIRDEGGFVLINDGPPDSGPTPSAEITSIEIQCTAPSAPDANRIDLASVLAAQFPALVEIRVDGGGGRDELFGPEATATWFVLSDDSGVVLWPESGPSLSFDSIESLTGSGESDGFLFSDGAHLSGIVDGGGGDDSIDFQDYLDDLAVTLTGTTAEGFSGIAAPSSEGFRGIETFEGGRGTDTLTGLPADGVWTLSRVSTYIEGNQSLGFVGFERLQGGPGNDTFEIIGDSLTSVTFDLLGGAGDDLFRFHGASILVGLIDGGGGLDTLSYAPFGSSVTVVLTGLDDDGYSGDEGLSFGGGGFAGIDRIDATPDGPDTLIGLAVASYWTLGAVAAYSSSPGRTLAVGDFELLQGGLGVDRFSIGAGTTADLAGGEGDDHFLLASGGETSGTIDGESGVDTLDASALADPVVFDLTSGGATRIGGGMARIENITGGAGADLLVGDASNNVLTGGPGDDRLVPGAGDDRILGGPGDDTYLITPTAGSLDFLEDGEGSDTLDFSEADSGISIDLDASGEQEITPDATIRLVGLFANAIGGAFDDVFFADAQAFPRQIEGGPPFSPVGDTLHFDARGAVVDLTPTTISPGGFAMATYSGIETLDLVNEGQPIPPQADLALAQVGTPEPRPFDEPITLAFLLTNRGPAAAADARLTLVLPPGLSSTSVMTSRGDFVASGERSTFDIGPIDPGGEVWVRITLLHASAGTFQGRLLVQGETDDPDPANNGLDWTATLLPRTAPPPPDGPVMPPCPHDQSCPPAPILLRLDLTPRRRKLVLQFSEGLDPARATDLKNYRLRALGRDRRFGTRDDRPIRIRSATYSPTDHSVTLTTRRRLPPRQLFQLIVRGASGIQDPAGSPSEGDFTVLFGRFATVGRRFPKSISWAFAR